MNKNIQTFLTNALQEPIQVLSTTPLSGGDINSVYKVTTSAGVFCVKQNKRARFPKMLEKEALGLNELSKKSRFRIPEVIGCFEDEHQQYLVLEFIDPGDPSSHFWEDFGAQLANMHRASNDSFGWKEDNYIGSLQQSNTHRVTWSEFYASERILPQLKLARDRGLIDLSFVREGERLCQKLEKLFPKESPALIHGDLWSGNYMIDPSGSPVLIDPAVYFGHREMDLGMMHLFGGFSERLFEVYHAHFPLENNWRDRIPLTQLYPLLVHVNLFGGSYVQSVQSILQKYT